MPLRIRVKGSFLILTGMVININPVKDSFSLRFPVPFTTEVYGNTLNFEHVGDELIDNIFKLNWEVIP